MSDDFADAVSKALRRAYSLGQTYWQQADSESYSQNRKADDTSRKFAALVDETLALARSGQAASGSSQGARWHAGWLVSNSEGDEEFVNNESALAGRHYKGGAPLALSASFERSDVQNGVGQPEAPTAAPPKRDSHRGGSSYEASMLRDLLARIHRDGGHYVEAHGLDKAIDDAHVLSASRISALEMLVEAKRAKDAGDHARHDLLKPLAWAAAFAVVERSGAHPPARSGADFSTSDPCPSCRGVGSIGEPPIQCPFCRLHKLGQEAARSGAGSDDRKDESWK